MRSAARCCLVVFLWTVNGAMAWADPLPFLHKVEVFRDKAGDANVFVMRLEQPFLAEEFEKSGALRLQSLDRKSFLIYPKETKFSQKHAEFFGRLRGQGKAKVRLSYEILSENPDGTRKVDVRHGDVEIDIPTEPTGSETFFRSWAHHQNRQFLELLHYYPDETFFQYCLLQSRDRYGVTPPNLPVPTFEQTAIESALYDTFTNSLRVQQTLQSRSLMSPRRPGDATIHVSNLTAPNLRSLDYAQLLREPRPERPQPKPHELSKLTPDDQYFLHFHSISTAGELLDLSNRWGDSVLRLFTISAKDNRLEEKLEEQLCLKRGLLTKLFADGVIAELAITGSDPFVLEGTDLTFLFRLKQPALFDAAADAWLADAKKKHPDMLERDFNYRGHKVAARYTTDRVVSSFVTRHEDVAVFSNSHASVRKVIDVATGKTPRLFDALDYRYVTTILPPSEDRMTGYLFASEAFIKRLIGPEIKIAERRRLECFNNLVMLNNASLFYRLEHGKTPGSLTDLVQGRFVDLDKVICPHGGAYAFDPKGDTCTCTLHNRIKYLTPSAELPVLRVSKQENDEYDRYRARYESYWRDYFDPVAVRITVDQRLKFEGCVLPFANGNQYEWLRSHVEKKPLPLDTKRYAPSAVLSVAAVHGRKNIGELLQKLPGVPEALRGDATLTDLSWLGDRVSFHLCDGASILEFDPTRLGDLELLFPGKVPLEQQFLPALALAVHSLPSYVSVEIEDKDKAQRLLDHLAGNLFLQREKLFGLPKNYDAYKLPEYKKHQPYVLTYQVYALKMRLHVALVGNQLVATTRPELLREVIDAAASPEAKDAAPVHASARINVRALKRLQDDLQLHWEEKVRLACHRNAISIYNLLKLYEVPIEDVPRLSEAKYGVRPFCPDHGTYSWDARRDQVLCSTHGNRQDARQSQRLDQRASFAELIDQLEEITASWNFKEDALLTTVEIVRKAAVKK